MKLDKFDLRILDVLQRDGRITKAALAREIGLSTTPCWERLRRLENVGYIKAYRAQIDLKKIVRTEFFMVEVTLRRHEAHDFTRFEAAVREIPEVLACDAVGGGVDYIMKVVAADIEHYQSLIENLLDADLGIARYFTYAVTKPVKDTAKLPIQELLDRQSGTQ